MLSSSWRHIVIVVAGSLAYLNSLVNPFVLDDEGTVLENEQIRTLWSADVLAPERELPVAGRPVVNVTFALNHAIGGLDVMGYHLVNIGIHVACALLLFGVARLLLLGLRGDVPLIRGPTDVAFAVALIWLVHPLNSEAVDYLTQRTESLMAAFYLLTLYASLRALDSRRPVAWYVVAALSCALGMASKESMVTAPVMVILVDRVFLYGSFAQTFRARWRLYAALASTWLVLGALLWTGPRPQSAGFGAGVSAWTYLLNQAPLITRYLRLTVWPTSLVANYGWPVPTTLADVFPYVVFVASLVGLTVAALWRQPKLGFLGAWFFIALAPTSSFVPIATEVGAERRMYLPVMAVIALAVLLAGRILRARVVHAILLVVVAALLARQTLARNREYSSGLQLAQVTLERYPTPSARHVLAENLLQVGRRDEAMTQLWQALPGAPRAHYTLGVELYKDGRLDEAIEHLQAFIARQPRLVWVVDAYGILGQAFEAQRNWPAAVDAYRAVLGFTPNNPTAHRSLASVLTAAERFDEAIPHYRRYLAAYPNDCDALNQLGLALGSTGRLDEALETLGHAVAIDPGHAAVRHNLALALYMTGRLDEALVHARRAAALRPDNRDSRELLQGLLALEIARDGAPARRGPR